MTAPPGYMLRLSEGELDSARFERLVLAAKDMESSAALDTLQEAMSLWSGRPFDNVAYDDFAVPEIRRLDELRLQAQEALNDARLEMGEAGTVLTTVEVQLDAHPFSEVFWGQYMLALYRSGRQKDALRAYSRASEVFAEIGTEPPSGLSELESRILVRDPTLDPIAVDFGARDNLPAYLSSFVGRLEEMESIVGLLRENRLVTLVGTGGIGKTRLGVEVARRFVSDGRDSVWFIELAGADPGDPIAPRVIAGVGVPRVASAETDCDVLRQHLMHRQVLLVMDNCEHLVPAVADFVHELLIACTELRVLATSRQPLGADGELIVRVATLPLDDGSSLQSDATHLFLDRVTHADGTLDIGSLDSLKVDDVIRATAGIPLAIELAASRLGTMSLEQLSELVHSDADVLGKTPDGQRGRHGAMRTTVDWSYRLLRPEARARFRRLSVFRGGFTLDTAVAFLSRFDDPPGDAIEALTELASVSLITVTAEGRYVLLEPIRQYAQRALEESGEMEAARTAHADVYRAVFQVSDTVIFHVDSEHADMFSAHSREIDNVAAAVAWAVDDRPDTAMELTSAAADFIGDTRSTAEALQWYDRVLRTPGDPTPARARSLTGAIFTAAYSRGVDSAQKYVDALVAVADELDEEQWHCAALVRQSDVAAIRGDEELAYLLTINAADRLEALGHPERAVVLNNRSNTLMAAGWFDRAEVLIRRFKRVVETHGTGWDRTNAELYLSLLAAYRGNASEAQRRLDCIDFSFWPEDAISMDRLMVRGHIAILEGRFDDAAADAWVLVDFTRKYGQPHGLMEGLILLGLVSFHEEDRATASRYLVEAISDCERLGHRWLRHELLATLASTVAFIDPTVGSELLAAEEAERHRDRRTLRAVVADVVHLARDEVATRLETSHFAEARQRGQRMRFEEALSLSCEAARSVRA